MGDQNRKKKGGRPRKAVTRIKHLGIRLTAEELNSVTMKASTAGYTVSEYMRKVAVKGVIVSRLKPEEKAIANELKAIGNNINQIARTAKQEGILSALLLLESYRDFVDALIKRFYHDK